MKIVIEFYKFIYFHIFLISMSFQNRKNNVLGKQDKSKKGSVDSHIEDLIDTINNSDNYYTTSSCSGRIVLLKLSESGKKNEAEWIFTSHELVNYDDIPEVLKNVPEEKVWLRFEPPILHVCCKNFESAEKMLEYAHKSGFKKSGIFSVKTLTLEINSNDRIDCLISKNKKLIANHELIKELVQESNIKMKECWDKIEKLKSLIEDMFED